MCFTNSSKHEGEEVGEPFRASDPSESYRGWRGGQSHAAAQVVSMPSHVTSDSTSTIEIYPGGGRNHTAAVATRALPPDTSDSSSTTERYPAQLAPQDAGRRPPKVGRPEGWKPPPSLPMINPVPTHLTLCDKCQNIDFDLLAGYNTRQQHTQSFTALQQAAPNCPLCALLFNSIQRQAELPASPNSLIWLIGINNAEEQLSASPEWNGDRRASVRGNWAVWGLQAVYNSPDTPRFDDNGKEIYEGRSYVSREPGQRGISRVYAEQLDLYADADSMAARSRSVSGRPIKAADDMTQAIEWFNHCITTHDRCNVSVEINRAHGSDGGPSRILELTENNGVHLRILDHQIEGYVALSYRWPRHGAVITTTSNIANYLADIDVSKLCKTIQDALYVTRQLGFRFLWVDSLCIIQDDPDDWTTEAAKMASIYEQALLTLSASVSTAEDEGLLLQRRDTIDVRVPYNKKTTAEPSYVYISDRRWKEAWGSESVPSSFLADVSHGPLSRRGWCLQERVLSRRILHFGKDQLHWECLAGYMSETSTEISPLISTFPEGRLREPLLSGLTFDEMPLEEEENAEIKVPPNLLGTEFEALIVNLQGPRLFGIEPYASWYSLVMQYTERQLTKSGDKLTALSGIARAFSRYAEDEYVAGLWAGDLVRGLLWHSGSQDDRLRRPDKLRPPTWSWVFVDGPVKWPRPLWDGNIGPTDFELLDGQRTRSTKDEFGPVDSAFLQLSGRVRRMTGMRGYDKEYLAWLRINHENLDYDCNPMFMQDLYDFGISELHCLLVASFECHPNCRHALGCDYDPMAWALVLYQGAAENGYTRAGLAQPGSVYVRVGLAKVFTSSFDHTPFQEILIS